MALIIDSFSRRVQALGFTVYFKSVFHFPINSNNLFWDCNCSKRSLSDSVALSQT